jgi:hypothetical protein
VRDSELPHRRRHDAEERRLEGRRSHDPGELAGRDPGDLRLGGLGGVEQGTGVPDQDPAGLGQVDVATDPLEQGRADFALEDRELLGHRAGRVAQRVGRGAHGVACLELLKEPEPVEVQHP